MLPRCNDFRRIRFLLELPKADYFALLASAVAVLDPFPASAVGATLDAFKLGVPVVTAPGSQTPGMRYAAGMYARMGLANCTAKSTSDYVRIAMRLAKQPAWRREVAAAINSTWPRTLAADRKLGETDFAHFLSRAVLSERGSTPLREDLMQKTDAVAEAETID